MPIQRRAFTTLKSARLYSTINRFDPVPILPTGDVETFRTQYFNPGRPVLFPRKHFSGSLPAVQKWFKPRNAVQNTWQLDKEYLSQFGDTLVPLELTTPTPPALSPQQAETTTAQKEPSETFHRFHAPLSLFLGWTSRRLTHLQIDPEARLYLAQASISDLPKGLSADLSTPKVVRKAGKGDLYDANIWIGVPPTCTPLHKDPNPNLFVQMAGEKVVRLFEPEVGRGIYERVRMLHGDGRASVRGAEMMVGEEAKALEEEVWGEGQEKGWEAQLNRGDGLFIPLGWWHSIRGVGEGVSGSVRYLPRWSDSGSVLLIKTRMHRSTGGFDDREHLD
ncbi:hypothetical protein H2201_001262 [Coniosporium apollinis]|uniref:JmjC domain-containing protein n=1 Tax=Coniosporium apollinis TaxID=61459 RepID=A0ABQ9P4U1_9PEZI|nr:hypothetical protein H2201_001262 [Coniosporium apollinis]